MSYLKPVVKRFITEALAKFEGPRATAEAVEKTFGIEVSVQQVHAYDPNTSQGRKLSPELRELFEKTREQFLTDYKAIAISHKSVRLRFLERILATAANKQDLKNALAALAEARKESEAFQVVIRQIAPAAPDTVPSIDRDELRRQIEAHMNEALGDEGLRK